MLTIAQAFEQTIAPQPRSMPCDDLVPLELAVNAVEDPAIEEEQLASDS
jgi:hypothetical protein